LATRCIEFLIEQAEQGRRDGAFIGLQNGKVRIHSLEDFERMIDKKFQRPREQWWLELRQIARIMAKPGPNLATETKEA
jgi:6-phosphofructokinase 1